MTVSHLHIGYMYNVHTDFYSLHTWKHIYMYIVNIIQVIRSGKTYHERAQLLVQLIHKKSAQQFVHFVETLVASENYSDLGRKLLVEGVVVPISEGEDDSERYGKVKVMYIYMNVHI